MIKNGILFFAFIFIAMSCEMKNSNKEKDLNTNKQAHTMEKTNTGIMPLDSLLNIRREAFAKSGSIEVKTKYNEGLEAVANSGILEKALNVGDKALNFTLNNQNGEAVTLYNELKKGPVVLTWYRGGWCPYCNINLHFLQERLPEFKKEGATLLALTPELPDQSLNTSEKHQLEFSVLSDVANAIGKQYGVVFKLTKDVAEIYQKNFDLHAYNGDESDELPLAVAYVIDTNGIVKYAFLDADYRKRAEPNDVLQVLKGLK